jgi:hypothetical protein
MTTTFVLTEMVGDTPHGIGEETFQVVPRAGDFVDARPEGAGEDVAFEVIALHMMRATPGIMEDRPAGELILRRVGEPADYWAAIRRRLGERPETLLQRA